MNLRGMGVGSRVLPDREHYERNLTPGHFWMTLLEGEHVSTDLAVRAGTVVWLRHSLGTPAAGGTFDYWTIEAAARAPLEGYLGAWVGQHLATYTGMLNLETIGGRPIHAPPRLPPPWAGLFGAGGAPPAGGPFRRGGRGVRPSGPRE